MLWLLYERGSSVIFASEEKAAGKTSMLSAFIDFIPPFYQKSYVYGPKFESPEQENGLTKQIKYDYMLKRLKLLK